MNEQEEYLVTEIQKIIEGKNDSYIKALRIVKGILIPAMEQIKEEFRMLELTGTDQPPN